SSRDAVTIDRNADWSKMTDQRTATVSKFVQVVLAYKDRAGSSQLGSDIGICGRNAVFVNRACRRGTHTGSVNQVFQPDGNAVQRTPPTSCLNFFLCLRRFIKRRFRGDGYERIT